MTSLADAVVLMSIYKPIIMMIVLVLWAWTVNHLDKDAMHFFLRRRMWNGIQVGTAAAAFGLWLLIPYFWVGFILAVIMLIGAIIGYVFYHNAQVNPRDRWEFTLETITQKIGQMRQEHAQQTASVTLLAKDLSALEVPSGQNPHTLAHQALEQILVYAVPRGADHIELTADGTKTSIVVQIDGVKYPQDDIDAQLGLAVIDYMKETSNLEVSDRRKRQVGKLPFDLADSGRNTLALTTYGSTRGVTMEMVINPEKRGTIPLEHLGMLPAQQKRLTHALTEPGHVVLVASPPHQGMTTTLYTLLQRHDPYTDSIITLEDQVAFDLEGVNHELIEPGMPPEQVSEKLTVMLRRDPQVVMLSQLTDNQSARVIAGSAKEVRFYMGMRATDCFQAVNIWLKAVGDTRAGSKALAAIVSQRLVRRLCTTCRIAYKPDPATLHKINVPAERIAQLYKHSGEILVRNKTVPCPDCLGLGYKGRVGVFEVITFDETARRFVAAGQFDQLRSHLRKQKALWLQEAALAKVVEGVTSISEITRVIGKESTAPAKPAKEQADDSRSPGGSKAGAAPVQS